MLWRIKGMGISRGNVDQELGYICFFFLWVEEWSLVTMFLIIVDGTLSFP